MLNKADCLETSDPNFVNKPLPYKEYLKQLCQSRVVIDLYRISPDEGLSFRTAEALILDKKTITNRNINIYNFFNQNKFFILNNELNELIEFVKTQPKKAQEENALHNQKYTNIVEQFNFIFQINKYIK